MEARWRKYSQELLQDAVDRSTSVNGVLRVLGLAPAGGTHAHISRAIRRFGIDTSHFVRYQNGARRRRLEAAQILVRRSPDSGRAKPHLLRRALAEIGRPYVCAMCGNDGSWQGRPLVLAVDHVDGDPANNEASNLRFVCPNCHSQTANFAGRSRNKYAHVLPEPEWWNWQTRGT